MAKNRALKKYDKLVDLDFLEERVFSGDGAIAVMMHGLVDATINK